MSTKALYRPETGERLTYADAQRINPLVEINTDESALNAMGFYRIQDEVDGQTSPSTTTDPYSVVDEVTPILVSGQYLRQYVVRPLFTGSYLGPDGLTEITVAMQQAAYDAAKLSERKVALTNVARASHAEAIVAGRLVTLPDTTQVRVDLTDSAALQRIMHGSTAGTTTRKLISRTGVHAMTVAEFGAIMAAVGEYQSALAVRLAEVLVEIGALTTMAAANAYSPVVVVNG
jgi:hypothetical protein